VQRLNTLLSATGSHQTQLETVKPTRVSIDSTYDTAYAVISIREYSIAAAGQTFRHARASAAAVLRGDGLVRLNMQREIRSASAVEAVRAQIAVGCRAVAAASAK